MARPGVMSRTSAVLASNQAVAAGSIACKPGSFDGPDEDVGIAFQARGKRVSGMFRVSRGLPKPLGRSDEGLWSAISGQRCWLNAGVAPGNRLCAKPPRCDPCPGL